MNTAAEEPAGPILPAPAGANPRARSWLLWARRAIFWLSCSYFALVLAALMLLRFAGDRWWPVSVLLFGPRLLLGLPAVILLPAAVLLNPRSLWPLLVAVAVLVGPILGFCVPLGQSAATNGKALRVLTYNIGGNRVDVQRLVSLVTEVNADVVLLQECGNDLSLSIPWPDGWRMQRAGELVMASRYALSSIETSQRADPPSPWPPVNGMLACLSMPEEQVSICCVHLMTPREGLSEVLDRHTVVSSGRSGALSAQIAIRQRESQHVSRWLQRVKGPLLIAGDFNMPSDSRIFADYWTGWKDAFSAVGFGFGYTKYEPLFGLEYGIRIDHVLTNKRVHPTSCRVGLDLGSDHRPVIVDVEVSALDATGD